MLFGFLFPSFVPLHLFVYLNDEPLVLFRNMFSYNRIPSNKEKENKKLTVKYYEIKIRRNHQPYFFVTSLANHEVINPLGVEKV